MKIFFENYSSKLSHFLFTFSCYSLLLYLTFHFSSFYQFLPSFLFPLFSFYQFLLSFLFPLFSSFCLLFYSVCYCCCYYTVVLGAIKSRISERDYLNLNHGVRGFSDVKVLLVLHTYMMFYPVMNLVSYQIGFLGKVCETSNPPTI